MRTILGYGVLALGIIFAAVRLQTPASLPAAADPAAFSAGRAFLDIKAIAQKPHPVTSAEHYRVLEYLEGRLQGIGLETSRRPGRGTFAMPGRIFTAPVVNLVGVLPGKDRTKPAVLVMTHYDSATNSPGAADDTAGVAAALEIARAFKTGPQPARDIVFLFTDGEEVGLTGAAAFFASDPLARHIGAVINFEARGDAGLTNMFETGPNDSETIAAYAGAVPRPNANSLARLIYRNMPNGSDFTLPMRRGLPGLNFAFIGDEAAYHTPLATPDHLSLGSVQHMGDQALAAARAFAAAIPAQRTDAVYSDVLGLFMIQYSFLLGWIVLAVAAALAGYAVWRAGRDTSYDWLRGSAGALLLLLLPGLLLWTAGRAFAGLDHFLKLAHFDFVFAGAGLIALGAVALVIFTVERSRGRWLVLGAIGLALVVCEVPGLDYIGLGLAAVTALVTWIAARSSRHPAALWPATLLLLTIFAAAAQAVAPEAAFVFAWPLMIAGGVAALRVSLPPGAWQGVLAAVIGAVAAVAFAAYLGTLFFTAVGVDLPVVLILPLLMLLPAMLLVPGNRPLPLAIHGALLVVGIAVFAFGRWAPATAERPKPAMVQFVQDQDTGKAYRVAYFSPLDAWEKSALGDGTRHVPLPWTANRPWWWTPEKPVALPASAVEIRRDGGRIVVKVTPPPGAYSAVLDVRPDKPVATAKLDGAEISAGFAPNTRNEIHAISPDPFAFSYAAPAHGTLEVRLFMTWLEWPGAAAPLPPMPKQSMAFSASGGTETVLQRRFAW